MTRGRRALVLFWIIAGGPVQSPPAGDSADASKAAQSGRGGFIVAFELQADRRTDFVWPLETFPPSRHTAVLLVVEEMPRARLAQDTEVRVLPAARHLQINGRLQTSRRPASPWRRRPAGIEDEFVVELRDGRLRLALDLPAGSRVDAQHRTVRVALYEIESVISRRK